VIREIIGARTIASLFRNNKRRGRRSMTRTGAVGTMASIGMAYMTYRAIKKYNSDT